MTKLLRIFALSALCAVLMASELRAETNQQRDLRLAHSIIAASGLLALSNDVRVISKAELTKRRASLAEQTRMLLPLTQRWSPAAITQRLLLALGHFSYTEKKQLLRTLQSPIVLGTSQREARMLDVLSTPEFQRYVERIQGNPPLEARIKLMRRLDDARGISVMAQRVRTDVMSALHDSRASMRSSSYGVTQRMAQRLMFAHRYQPDAVLEETIAIYRQPLLQRWLSLAQTALSKPSTLSFGR